MSTDQEVAKNLLGKMLDSEAVFIDVSRSFVHDKKSRMHSAYAGGYEWQKLLLRRSNAL